MEQTTLDSQIEAAEKTPATTKKPIQPLSQSQQDVALLEQIQPKQLTGTTEEKFQKLQQLQSLTFLTVKDLLAENNELTAFIKSHLPIAHTLATITERIVALEEATFDAEETDEPPVSETERVTRTRINLE